MNNPYTADDFARADFARHPDGGLAMRVRPLDVRPWETGRCYASDATMALTGWVPVPHGSYTRHDSPDYADGGMAAAAIEKEAGQAADCEARQWGFICTREKDHNGPHIAATTSLHHSVAEVWDNRPRIDWEALAEREEKRAEKAEQERDEALRLAKTAADQADDALGMVARGECHDCIRDAAVIRESRPLTLDAIVELVKESEARLADAIRALYPDRAMSTYRIASAVFDALTTPARPEGAEEIEQMVGAWDEREGGMTSLGPEDRQELADFLAERGVRVVTEEQP